jgi:hypothetical protein
MKRGWSGEVRDDEKLKIEKKNSFKLTKCEKIKLKNGVKSPN